MEAAFQPNNTKLAQNQPCLTMLLLGDRGVGKSSLILSLVTESFIPASRIPARCEPITIPKDVTPEQVETLIVDWSERDSYKLRDKIHSNNSQLPNSQLRDPSSLINSPHDSPDKNQNFQHSNNLNSLNSSETPYLTSETGSCGSSSVNGTRFASSQSSSESLEACVKAASVILLVYNVNDSVKKVQSQVDRWIEDIRKICWTDEPENPPPVILVGNKIDLREKIEKSVNTKTQEVFENPEENFMNAMTSNQSKDLMNKHREIELCIECSAKKLINISELFYQAQKVVLYPLQPLYQIPTRTLTKKAQKAIDRVFYLSDLDGDEHLDENELSELQRKSFNAPLPGQALDDLKSVVKNYDEYSYHEWKDEEYYVHVPEGNQQVTENYENSNNFGNSIIYGLTSRGFRTLMKALIERGRQDTVWILLRTFGYDNDLTMGRETGPFFLPNSITLRTDDCTELSDEARHFLAALFERCDLDKDGALNGAEQKLLFRPLPIPPWHRSKLHWQVICQTTACITLTGFLAWYDYKAFFEPRSVLSDLAYLGFPILSEHQLESAIDIRQKRQPSSQVFQSKNRYRPFGSPLASRRVFLVKILGARYSGKSTLMQGVIGHDLKTCQKKMRARDEPAIVTAEVGIHGKDGNLTPGKSGFLFGKEENDEYFDDYYVSLIFNEVPNNHIQKNNYSADLIEDADVIGIVYNPSEESSWNETLELYRKVVKNSRVPVLFVASVREDEEQVVYVEKVKQELEAELAGDKTAGYAVGPVEYDGKTGFDQFFSFFAKMAVDPGLLLKDSLNDSSVSKRTRVKNVRNNESGENKRGGWGFGGLLSPDNSTSNLLTTMGVAAAAAAVAGIVISKS